ncbi:hypothetical protein [Burkholderia gladioli]|uniref:hypothetical protein n=1 Tax=Burkholderia gladioli TaxID=28095 RepID=UPI00164099EF|nr:hypothetical protein [Burkholderia gladioli]
MSEAINFERQALYEEVWADPVSTVSKRYGMSDNGLRKICKKLGVPLPPLGHWAKLRAGQKVMRARLPSHDGPTTFQAWPEAYAYRVAEAVDATKNRELLELDEAKPENRIVPNEGGPWRHPLIKALATQLKEIDRQIVAENDPAKNREGWPTFHPVTLRGTKPGGLLDIGPGFAAVVVTPDLRQRALAIADAFFGAVEARGFKVHIDGNYTIISCKDVIRQFRLSEITEKAGHNPLGYDTWTPLRRLRITLRKSPHSSNGERARDEEGISLEDQLNDLVVDLRRAVLGYNDRQHRQRELAWERQEDQRRAEIRAWHERMATEAAQREKAAIDAVFVEADQSDMFERRRQYLGRLELAAIERGIATSPGSRLGLWLSWARAACDAQDPMLERLSAFERETPRLDDE